MGWTTEYTDWHAQIAGILIFN